MILISSMMFFTPLGGISLGPPIEVEGELVYLMTTYISYPEFQIYFGIMALGSIFVGIGLVGFFIRFGNIPFLAASETSFVAAALNLRCAVFPDWRLPQSGYTRETIDNLELFMLMTLLVTVIPLFLYCLPLFTKKGKTTLPFTIPILILGSTVFGGLLLVLFQNLANPQLFVGFETLRVFSIMSLTYIFALVSFIRGFFTKDPQNEWIE